MGRILGFDAQVHSVLTSNGRVHFENDVGLLAPLSAFSVTVALNFPEGLFNFTIQGLAAGGSVKLTIAFPDNLPSGVGWFNVMSGNPLGSGTVELSQLPASQVQVNGNNMTLILTNASQEGVISVVGGPVLPNTATASVTSANSTLPYRSGYPNSLILVPVLLVIVAAIGFELYRRRSGKI
jgi:hypothetical protein